MKLIYFLLRVYVNHWRTILHALTLIISSIAIHYLIDYDFYQLKTLGILVLNAIVTESAIKISKYDDDIRELKKILDEDA